MANGAGRLPTFLVIGAAKSGTTALHHTLGQHPDIFMSPVKEPRFFANDPAAPHPNLITSLEAYSALFAGAGEQLAIGEVSPAYLASDTAPARIKATLPDARLIAILRNPIEQVFANYATSVRRNLEPARTLAEALASETVRIGDRARRRPYLSHARYHCQLSRYYDLFPRANIRVYLYDDLLGDAPAILADMFAFVGVDPAFAVDTSTRHNVSTLPRSRLLNALLGTDSLLHAGYRRLVPAAVRARLRLALGRANTAPAQITAAERAHLAPMFESDIKKLATLLGRDLSDWLVA